MIAIAPEHINLLALPSLLLESRRNLPNKSALYFVFDADDELLYIGKTISLVERWRGHHRVAQLEQLDNVRIAWMECDKELIDSSEEAFIAHFNPSLNKDRRYRELTQNKKQSFITPQKLNLYRGTLESPIKPRNGKFNWQYGNEYKVCAIKDLKNLAADFQQIIKWDSGSEAVKSWVERWSQFIQEALEDKRDFDQTIKDCNEALRYSPLKPQSYQGELFRFS